MASLDHLKTQAERRLIFLGPAGCGKGTQSAVVKEAFKLNHLSTGDMLREAVAAGTDLGKKAKAIMDAGELVSDSIVLGLVEQKISSCPNGFILDGFPRTVAQAEGLSELTKKLNTPIDAVILFDIDEDLLLRRVCGRRVHAPSGRVYHIEFNPPKVEGKDDITGEPLIHRKDDNEETFKKRMAVYKSETAPLIDYYTKANLLHRIDASKPTADVSKAILSLLCAATH